MQARNVRSYGCLSISRLLIAWVSGCQETNDKTEYRPSLKNHPLDPATLQYSTYPAEAPTYTILHEERTQNTRATDILYDIAFKANYRPISSIHRITADTIILYDQKGAVYLIVSLVWARVAGSLRQQLQYVSFMPVPVQCRHHTHRP